MKSKFDHSFRLFNMSYKIWYEARVAFVFLDKNKETKRRALDQIFLISLRELPTRQNINKDDSSCKGLWNLGQGRND